MNQQGQTRKAFARAADLESFVLKENQGMTFPQLHNRLQWQVEESEFLKRPLDLGKNHCTEPWLRLLSESAKSASLILTLSGHTDGVLGCSLSPDGRRIVSASKDQTVKLWDAESGRELSTLKGHKSWVSACAFSRDGKRIVVGDSTGQGSAATIENIEITAPVVTPVRTVVSETPKDRPRIAASRSDSILSSLKSAVDDETRIEMRFRR